MIHIALPLALLAWISPAPGGFSYESAVGMLAPAPAPRADRLSELLPGDAFLVLRARSAQRVLDDLNLLMGNTSDSPERLTARDLLEPLGSDEVASKLALDRPIGLAMTFGAGSEPQLTAALPVLDAAAVLAALPASGAGFHALAAGDYVVVSTLPDFQLPSVPNALIAGLEARDLVLHVDVARFMAKFRPLIEMGVEQAEMALEQVEVEPGEPDPSAAAETYFDLAREFMDSAESLELALDAIAGRVHLGGRFTVKEGSSMSKYYPGARRDISRLGALVDADAAFVTLGNADPSAKARANLQWMEDVADAMPAKVRELVELQTRVWRDMLPKAGGLSATSIDLSIDGLRGVSYLEARDPQALIASVQQFMAAPELARFGVQVDGPQPREVAGTAWSEYRLVFDLDTFAQMFGAEVPIEASDKADAQHALDAFLGRGGLRLGLAIADGFLVARINGDDSTAQRAVARLRAPAPSLGTGLDNALAAARVAQAAYVGQVDIGRVMNQIADLAASLGHDPDLPVALLGNSFPVSFHGAVDGRTWLGGVEVDSLDIARFVAAMRAEEAPMPTEPIEVDGDDDK